jgi:hypothetical protein
MMRCKQVQRQLAEYVDDLLGARERDAVKAHLARCEGCRVAARDTAAAAQALSALRAVRPPASFAPRVRSAIRAQAPRALAPPLFSPDVRAALSGAFLMLLGVVGTRYLAQPPLYVAPARTVTVAMASAAPAGLGSIEARPASASAHGAQPASRSHRSTERASWRRSGLTRTLSAITGPAPSKDRLAPKATDANRTPARASAMTSRTVADGPGGPALGRGSLRLAAVADGGATPRPAEETPEEAPRLVALPASDGPSAEGVVPAAVVALTSGTASSVAGAASVNDANAPFGFDDMFNESSLSRYADVS